VNLQLVKEHIYSKCFSRFLYLTVGAVYLLIISDVLCSVMDPIFVPNEWLLNQNSVPIRLEFMLRISQLMLAHTF
jgi:hypothetical protein